ncbi:MAG: hypothetical protein FWC73_10395 [Defluviitaleaceae bacterium]|nr:hypothetical protein [Defluviitaleaceae bacterium]
MNTFIAQLSQLLMSADEDSWLAGLVNLLRSHTDGWVHLTSRNGKAIAEALPSCGYRPENPQYSIEKPILAGETILGRISISRQNSPFTPNEEQMLEIAACICIMQLRHLEKQAQLQHKQRAEAVREVINVLSYSELEAAVHVIGAINGIEGRLIAGNIADKLGFTRSIIVTALRKLEGAGVIETRSLGVKGTFIRIREPILAEELGKLRTAKH